MNTSMTTQIIALLNEHVEELKDEPLEPDTPLIEGGYIDSFDIIDLISALEQAFDIDIPLAGLELADFETPARIAAFVSDVAAARQ